MKKGYYKFIIPVQPDSINKVCEYGKTNGDIVKLKKKWEKIARLYVRKSIIEEELPEKFDGKIGVHFKLFFKLQRERDGDNYTLMCKGILDAFVQEGMIVDDNFNHVDDDGRRFEIDTDQSRVEVHITEKKYNKKTITIDYAKR